MSNSRNPFSPTAGSKKPELVEKVEEQVGSDLGSTFGFLGNLMNEFIGYDEPQPVKKLPQSTPQVQQQALICKVCGGTGMVGRLGYEVDCPSCKPNNCKTCRGSGKLGTEGFEIDCPMCQIEARK